MKIFLLGVAIIFLTYFCHFECIDSDLLPRDHGDTYIINYHNKINHFSEVNKHIYDSKSNPRPNTQTKPNSRWQQTTIQKIPTKTTNAYSPWKPTKPKVTNTKWQANQRPKPNSSWQPKNSDNIDSCLKCLCQVNSGCQNAPCKQDRGSLSCGYFQLKSMYWTDCGRPGKDFESCAGNYECAESCVRNYFKKYASQLRQCVSGADFCPTFARLHTYGAFSCGNTQDVFGRARDMERCMAN
jgi:hypothetical protein